MKNDLIKRQDAINTALEFFVEFLGGAFHEDDQKILMKRMNDIPSADPERTAKIHDDKIHPVIHHCGKDIVTLINPTWSYCPCCGKKLEWI